MSKTTKFLAGVTMMVTAYNAIAQERNALKSENAGLKQQLEAAKAEADAATKGDPDGLSAEDLDKALSQIETVVGSIPDADVATASAADTASSQVTVATATAAGADTVAVTGPVDASMVGSVIAGPGVPDGATVKDVILSQSEVDGDSLHSIVLSAPTTADHVGDGTETLTIASPAAAGSGIDPLTGQLVA